MSTRHFLQEIARERIKGRILLISTTNLDTQKACLIGHGPDRDEQQSRRDNAVPQDFAGVGDCDQEFFRRCVFRCWSVDRITTNCMWMATSPDGYSSPFDFFVCFPRSKIGKANCRNPQIVRDQKRKDQPEWQSVSECPVRLPRQSNRHAHQEPGDRRSLSHLFRDQA